MVKELEHTCCKERLREPGLHSPEEEASEGDLIDV